MSRTFTLAVERVADDRRFAARFRRDPRRALRRYRLDDEQIEAIKTGDVVPLARHGLDVEGFQRGDRHGWRPHWRKALAAATLFGAVVGLARGPVSATCDLKTCGKPILTGLRLSNRRATVGRDQIRLGRYLVTRTSLRAALVRAGARMDEGRAYGRRALRARLDAFCPETGCIGLVEDADPILLAEGEG